MSLNVGDQAPDFELLNGAGDTVRLSDFKGQKVIVVFYPLAFSGICQNELTDYNSKVDRIKAAGARVLGISVDSFFAVGAFAEAIDLDDSITLLSDFPDHAAGKAYGAYNSDTGFNERVTVVVDEDGRIVYQTHNPAPERRNEEEALAALG
jgi:peroxiredoxin